MENIIKFGDCREIMSEWKIWDDVKVQTCVTSPPYFGLRDYGTAKWEGGDPLCDHSQYLGGHGDASKKQVTSEGTQKYWYKGVCKKCGAVRKDEQLGLEQTPDEYVKNMVQVFRYVRDILADDGTLWLNLGDSYWGSWGNAGNRPELDKTSQNQREKNTNYLPRGGYENFRQRPPSSYKHPTLKPKDLIGIPWRVAFALQADGWYLRQDIIWHKPNPMPESVTDRCTKAHEYIFLFSKSKSYYFDSEAIKEPAAMSSVERLSQPNLENQLGSDRVPGKTNGRMKAVGHLPGNKTHKGTTAYENGDEMHRTKAGLVDYCAKVAADPSLMMKRNRCSVWTVTTKPYKGAHFATFPPDLIEPCILAGSRAGDIVLDPFMGSGTTAAVALKHGRRYLGCELNPKYKELQEARIKKVLDT